MEQEGQFFMKTKTNQEAQFGYERKKEQEGQFGYERRPEQEDSLVMKEVQIRTYGYELRTNQ